MKYIISILLLITLKIFVLEFTIINGKSMNPALKDGDIVLIWKINSYYQKNDVISFFKQDISFIKRVEAIEDDSIQFKNDIFYINDHFFHKKQNKEFRYKNLSDKTPIEKNQFIVIGDNRSNSFDSRQFGTVHQSEIIGKAIIVLFSIDKNWKIRHNRIGMPVN